MTEHSAQRSMRLVFSWLFLFLLYPAQCLTLSECQTRQIWLQTVLSHRTTHHSPASSTFEAPWTEHAQWRLVNKSLVEALMAVAHLVRLCTDPESDQGPPAYRPAHGFNIQIQRTNRAEKCLGRYVQFYIVWVCFLKLWITRLHKRCTFVQVATKGGS